ncbi:MAG: PAS domain S-box protein [Spirochaetia bacterium]|jgi:PAS domain S-box-containing protein
MTSGTPDPELLAEIEDLRIRLAEAEEILRAIRSGEVDALVIAGDQGEKVHILGEGDRVYRQFIETINDGTATLSADGDILSCNAFLAKTLRRPLVQVLGTAMRDHLPPEDHEVFRAILAQAGTESHRRKIRLKTSEGRLIPIYLSATLLQNAEGLPVFCLVLTDLEEVISAEAALRESEQRYRTLLKLAPVGIAVYSEGKIVFINPAGAHLFGADSEELIAGKPITEIIHPDRLEAALSRIRGMMDSELGLYPAEDIFLKLDGTPINVEVIATPLPYKGKPAAQVIITDITKRKRGEAERERLMASIEQVGETVLVTDPEGIIQYVNPAFITATGYSREEALGRNPRFLKSGEQDRGFYQELWQTISSGKSWQGTLVNKRKDGKNFTEDATISPVCDASGRIVSYVAVKRDITAQLLMEDRLRQAQKMETVGRLAGGVAHDFNNMLQVIITYAEISLAKVGAGQPLHKYLMEIRRAAQRSAEITGQLLAFARKQTVMPKVLDLNDAVASTQKMIQRLIGEDIDLAWKPGHDLWKVKIDPAQLDQILANLAVNARDAIGGVGKLAIKTEKATLDEEYCATHAGAVPGEYLQLSVSDNGQGMDKETLLHLFEPFFTTKAPGKGTGLGLATIYGIVKQNNGFINVHSEQGKGTTFKVYLPRAEGATAAEQMEVEAAPLGGTETVLVVEDEAAILELARESLEQLGYTVLVASSPEEAIRRSEEQAGLIQLLITDVVMPQMNGRQLAERLGAIHPEMKCLYMSGYTADVIAHRGVLDAGVRFIGKPFSLAVLAEKVREVLEG